MNQRHKHADVIIAWANGAKIEYKSSIDGGWVLTSAPRWLENCEYRVKPPAKKYRVALFKDPDYYTSTADTQEDVAYYESCRSFVRWLTDWVEYEEK